MTHSCNNLYPRPTEGGTPTHSDCMLNCTVCSLLHASRRLWEASFAWEAQGSAAQALGAIGDAACPRYGRTQSLGRHTWQDPGSIALLSPGGGRYVCAGTCSRCADTASSTQEALRSSVQVAGAITAQLKRFAQGAAGRVRLSVRGYLLCFQVHF